MFYRNKQVPLCRIDNCLLLPFPLPSLIQDATLLISLQVSSIVTDTMDEFPRISDHGTLLQGHGVLGAEGRLGIRSSEGKSAPTQDDRRNKRKKDNMLDSDWPELVSLDDFDPRPRYPLAIF